MTSEQMQELRIMMKEEIASAVKEIKEEMTSESKRNNDQFDFLAKRLYDLESRMEKNTTKLEAAIEQQGTTNKVRYLEHRLTALENTFFDIKSPD